MSAADFDQLAAQRKQQGFTVILLVVGVPPEVHFWSNEARCAGQHPFSPDYHPNAAYFDAIEPKIAKLVSHGLVPCLVGGWGPHASIVGQSALWAFWQTMIQRLSKYNPVWCLCGEADLVQTPSLAQRAVLSRLPLALQRLVKKTKTVITTRLQHQTRRRQLAIWQTVGERIHAVDPQHLLLAHPHSMVTTDALFDNPSWLDVITIQSGHSLDRSAFLVSAPLDYAARLSAAKSKGLVLHNRPFINLEPWYEGIRGMFGARTQRYAFYTSILAGARGHTYGADGLWNMRTAHDQFLSHWGTTNWQQARVLPGATQLGLGKNWFAQWEWWRSRPQLAATLPHWTDTDVEQPLCAQLPDGSFLCYLPNSQSTFTWLTGRLQTISWYDPRSTHLITITSYNSSHDSSATNCLVTPPSPQICDSPDLLAHVQLLQK